MPFVQDNVHNRIELTDLEGDLIRTSVFARLSRLRQLGLASFVYPGASHSRAAHSIGVMHTVAKACDALKVEDEDRKLLRAAGLLHDIGQYPLSHCIELVYRAIGNGVSAGEFLFGVKQDDERALLHRVTSTPSKFGDAKDKAIGEWIVLKDPGIGQVLEKHNLGGAFRERLAKLVGGKATRTFYSQLLDSPYDCDRLDYVRRDSEAAGVEYGHISVDFILEKAKLERDPPNSDELIMAFDRQRGVVALEQYLIARYGMYSQVYYHKTVRSLELMARAVHLRLAEHGRTFRTHKEIREAIGTPAYLHFDDSHFWQLVARAQEDPEMEPEVQVLARRVATRQPLKEAFAYRTLTEPGQDATYILLARLGDYGEDLEGLCADVGIDASQVVVDRVPPIDFVPGSESLPPDRLQALLHDVHAADDPKEVLDDALGKLRIAPRVVDADRRVSFLTGDPGSLIAHLAGKSLYIVRFYLTEGNDDQAKRLGRALAQHARSE